MENNIEIPLARPNKKQAAPRQKTMPSDLRLHDLPKDFDPASLHGNIENYIGMTQVPTGLVGPLRINGDHATGTFYIPMATTEGALVASYSRGAKACTLSGGVTATCLEEKVQRCPLFRFETLSVAIDFVRFVEEKFDL